jgi:hypothetical protein
MALKQWKFYVDDWTKKPNYHHICKYMVDWREYRNECMWFENGSCRKWKVFDNSDSQHAKNEHLINPFDEAFKAKYVSPTTADTAHVNGPDWREDKVSVYGLLKWIVSIHQSAIIPFPLLIIFLRAFWSQICKKYVEKLDEIEVPIPVKDALKVCLRRVSCYTLLEY